MPKPSITAQTTNVVFFIGGGADKTRERFGIVYWGPTRLMEHAMQRFNKVAGKCSVSYYFGYLERKKLVKKIVKLHRKHPHLRINLVGHSRGGSVAVAIATKHLRKKGIEVNLLIALDPVKANHRHTYRIPKKKAIHNVHRFISVFAKPRRRGGADYIALIGGQYGTKLKKRSHHFVQTPQGHGQPLPLLYTHVNEQLGSSFDCLLAESNT